MANGEILSDAEVDFLLSAAAEDETPADSEAGYDEQSVTMRGDLEQICLADIFQTLSMSKMEGVLRLRNPLVERHVMCRDGYVRLLVGNRIVTKRLGQRLVQAGLVAPDQLRDALTAQKQDKRPIGQLLVHMGVITQETIDDIVGTQIAEDLFALFTWRHGSFEFFKGPPTSPAVQKQFAECPEFEVNSLLLEVARRQDEWESIFDALGSLDEVPRAVAAPEDESEFSESHLQILRAVDGHTRYREIAETLTIGLFEAARAARDLVRADLVVNLTDAEMVTLAAHKNAGGDKKRALIILQTLRDRPGDRPIGVLEGMAKALETAGERRQAGALLLEAAQRHTDPQSSVALARAAQTLCPHDAATLSFLRTVLIAHSPSNSQELEQCTLALLDALIEADLVPTALEIFEDARRTGSAGPAILMREVRARQKTRDTAGACGVLEELARLHDERGEAKAANEAYEALLRLDRARKDIRRLLSQRRRTRAGKFIRVIAIGATVLMVGAMGLVFWQQHTFNQKTRVADSEITELLAAGDRAGARARLEHWLATLGECEPVEDLRNRIAFAEAAETGRKTKLLRTRVNSQLTAAAELLGKGEVIASLDAYQAVAATPEVAEEVHEVVRTRVAALVKEMARVGKVLGPRLPPAPGSLFDRRELLQHMTEFQAACAPSLLRSFDELAALADAKRLPASLDAELVARIETVVAESRTTFTRARDLMLAYQQAIERNDQQRQLDPLFKAAVEAEAAHDFAGALARYRELERQPATEGDLRTHFRDRLARNATIVQLTEALRAATEAGDYATACQHLKALRLSFPDVPFDRLVRLPLQVDSQPRGARVLLAGQDVGATPLLLTRLPAESVQLTVRVAGFRDDSTTITGDGPGAWHGFLFLNPDSTLAHDSMVEVPPLLLGNAVLLVDRAGTVTSRAADGTARWTFRSGDLSGLLTAPVLHGDQVLLGSLDGDLRSVSLASGEVAWSLPDMPTEVAPLLVGDWLLVATTTRSLCAVDLGARTALTANLPQPAIGSLHRHGSTVLAIGERGHVAAFLLPGLRPRWQRALAETTNPLGVVIGDLLVIVDDRGHVTGLDIATGEVRLTKELDRELFGAPLTDGRDLMVSAREQILRVDCATGRDTVLAQIPAFRPGASAMVVGSRLVVPLQEGPLQVIELPTGSPLYRIHCDKKGRALAAGSRLYVVDPERRLHVYDRMR